MKGKPFTLLLGVCNITFWVLFYTLSFHSSLENLLYDWVMKVRGERKIDVPVIIVDINDDSRKAFGRNISSWERRFYGKVIRNLADAGAKVIGVDIMFSAPSIYGKEDDDYLRDSIEYAGNVFLAGYFSSMGLTKPLEDFLSVSSGLGIININPDPDGKVRKLQMIYGVLDEGENINYIPSFSLLLAGAYLFGENGKVPPIDLSNASLLRWGDMKINIREGSMFINYMGKRRNIKYVPFEKIYSGDFNKEEVKGKIVMIGNTSYLFHDYYTIPFSGWFKRNERELRAIVEDSMPGVEIHAHALSAILMNKTIKMTSRITEVILIFIAGIFAWSIFIAMRLPGSVGGIIFLFFLCGIWCTDFLCLSFRDTYFSQFPMLALSITSFITGLWYHRSLERREKRVIKETFGRYMSPQIVNELLKNPSLIRPGGVKKELTIFFCDIRDFTLISEKMNPDSLVDMVNSYFSAMTEVVFSNGGVIDKFIGDAIMAFFGAPIDDPDHAVKACRCALQMVDRLEEFNKKNSEKGYSPLMIGIGINTDVVVIGNMGSESRMDYTVIGDGVNLASRVEGLTKEYKVPIVISENTANKIKDHFALICLGEVKVKGKEKSVKVYSIKNKEV